jgi:plastocyanin
MTARSPLVVFLAVAAVGGVAATGCGGDDDAPATPAAAMTEGGAGGASNERVEIADFAFDPETVTVDAGTKLTWTNDDEAPHTATADDGSFDTGTLKLDDTGAVALDQAGTYTYYCRFHPFMKGTVEVR